jgi:uncharacterized protein
MCPCRGRRRGKRWISEIPPVNCFMPEGNCPRERGCPREAEYVTLTLEELEAVRLVDLLELEQEEAAFYMGISRKAFWNDLVSARKKITAALVYGAGIKIEGGTYAVRDLANGSALAEVGSEQVPFKEGEVSLLERERLVVKERLDYLSSKLATLKEKSGSTTVNGD